MNDSESLGLLATLREVTEQLAGLDLTALPELCAVQVTPDFHHGGLCGKAQLAARCPTELEEIDAIRTWAVALGAVVLLDEERPDPSGPYRQIAAVLRLPSGLGVRGLGPPARAAPLARLGPHRPRPDPGLTGGLAPIPGPRPARGSARTSRALHLDARKENP